MMKNLVWAMISLTVFSIISCSGGNYTTIKSKENSTTTSTEMSYSSFKGKKYKSLNLKASDKIKLDIDVKTKEGDLKVALVDDDSNELFSIENPTNHITENITIPKTGAYYIEISGNHSGSYEVNWDIIS